MTKVRKKELGDWCKNKSEDRDAAKTQLPVKSVVMSMSTIKGAAASKAKKAHDHLEK